MENKNGIHKRSVMKSTKPYCSQCNEHIITSIYNMSEYIYKVEYNNRQHYFCSWNCMRRWQRDRGLISEQSLDINRDTKSYDAKRYNSVRRQYDSNNRPN